MHSLIIIGGPTASGKSALALHLAEQLGGAVINADSLQVYAELSILTARPSAEDEARAPHHLYGHQPGSQPMSMALWVSQAQAAIKTAQKAGLIPIVVGGTGMYLRALTDGFSDIPAVPDDIREAVAAKRDALGPEAFFDWLAERDPVSGNTLSVGDTQRVLRAAEVVEGTGKPLSAWHQAPDSHPGLESFDRISLIPPREPLYERCDSRLWKMVEMGALDEVANFAALNLPANLPINKALGLPELRAHLAGEMTLEDAIAAAQQGTRNYAKRQLTWLRNQIKPDPSSATRRDMHIPAQYSETFLGKIVSFVQK